MLKRIGTFFFHYRNMAVPVFFACLALLSRPHFPAGNRRYDIGLDGLGVALVVIGQGLRVLVIALAYIKRGGKGKKIYADGLVQEGIFAHCRNPLYVGNVLVCIGIIVIHNGLLMYLLGVPFTLLMYLSITMAEEDYLRKQFGQKYADYCKRVPRFGFRLAGLKETFRRSRFNWTKVLNKEYGTLFASISIVIALLISERADHYGFDARSPMTAVLGAIWLACLAGYIIARILKKTGRLQTT